MTQHPSFPTMFTGMNTHRHVVFQPDVRNEMDCLPSLLADFLQNVREACRIMETDWRAYPPEAHDYFDVLHSAVVDRDIINTPMERFIDELIDLMKNFPDEYESDVPSQYNNFMSHLNDAHAQIVRAHDLFFMKLTTSRLLKLTDE
ncbi:hypothetical protein [Pseudooceanicola sp. MF1-13]|uniref:hypothetical protein n=1 Tax=Pseudooceanicola sp. MF1-13 TaxID=3379095 RepID=UPI0038928903